MIGLISTVVLVSLIVVLVVPLIVVGVSELEFVVIVIIVAASIAESMKIEGATVAAALVDAKDRKHSSKLHQ